ncbi:MAG: peroxiredoxin family protein [Myxococcales bacterium]|nr:peroxiredoxin family protein [Myxococcales bacterium]
MQSQRGEFEKRGAELVALSADPVETSKELAGREKLSLTLVSDPERKIIGAFGLDDPGNEVSWPAVYVLGPDGTVVYRAFLETYKERPPVADILAAVERAKNKR